MYVYSHPGCWLLKCVLIINWTVNLAQRMRLLPFLFIWLFRLRGSFFSLSQHIFNDLGPREELHPVYMCLFLSFNLPLWMQLLSLVFKGFLESSDFHYRTVSTFNAALSQNLEITDIEYWFSALFLGDNDFFRVSQSSKSITYYRW